MVVLSLDDELERIATGSGGEVVQEGAISDNLSRKIPSMDAMKGWKV